MAQKSYQLAFGGTAAPDSFYGDVVSLSIQEDINMATSMTLQLVTTLQNDGTWSHLDDGQFSLFTHVTAKVGFSGSEGLAGALGAAASAISGALGSSSSSDDGLIPLFDGYITSVKVKLSNDPQGSVVEVTALDTCVLMSLEEKVASWTNMTDSDIVQQIVGGYGVTVQADTTSTLHQDNVTTLIQRGSDIQFVRELAERNGKEFYFETDTSSGEVTAYFQSPQLTGTPQPDLAIQFASQSNLKSFDAWLDGQRPLSVKVQQVDISSGNANSAQVSDTLYTELGATDSNTLIGAQLDGLVTPLDAQAQMLLLATSTSDSTELQTIAQSVRDEAAWVITATGEINSDAYQSVLRAHRLVLVKGAGKPYSGKYYVSKVAHELKADGTYTQHFEARRNARDIDGSENFGGSGLGIAIPGV
jgi:phage protein D